jgi:hypothetical protein
VILGIICFLLFIVSLLIFAYYNDENNYIGMILCIFIAIIGGLGIITFIIINMDKIVSWFTL